MVAYTLSVLDQKYLFFGKFGKKTPKIVSLSWNFVTLD